MSCIEISPHCQYIYSIVFYLHDADLGAQAKGEKHEEEETGPDGRPGDPGGGVKLL